jgi:hypothetical protein
LVKKVFEVVGSFIDHRLQRREESIDHFNLYKGFDVIPAA